ncbi:hypothetical protein [[Mycoplasma] gypis]|uniref:Uncharacterized protein n=1 Tax=[Mycoplasma] gypis TaxID=92404 RepID=A0ABZ2RWB6_9BACT|nr:hypothetical protein [[Mycoplasma] gypis]MBN0919424.1 hypothetical protein [[Mycoplasma] gypis]
MVEDFKNKKEIKKIKKIYMQQNPEQEENIALNIVMYSIDNLISLIKAHSQIKNDWEYKIKPERIKSLKERKNYLLSEIKYSTNQLQQEKATITPAFLKTIDEDSPQGLYFYTSVKNWVEKSYKNIERMQSELNKVNSELLKISNDNNIFLIDETGKLINKNFNFSKAYGDILNLLQANLSIQLTKQKIKNLIEEDNEEEDDDEL